MNLETTDPVIVDLLEWLKVNLPPDVEEEAIFKKVRRVQKVFDKLMSLAFEEFYNYTIRNRGGTLEEAVNRKLDEIRDYIILHEDKQSKTKRLDASTAKLDLKRQEYELITSISLDSCMDLIGRYNHLMSKK